MTTPKTHRIARCSCGSVELEAIGAPIASVVCYCDDCQEGSRQLEALPNAGPVQDADGGTAYVLYRTDRVKYVKGAELLRGHKINEKSKTSRVVATCCNSAMVVKFDELAALGDDVPGAVSRRYPAPAVAHFYEIQVRERQDSQ